MWQEVGQKIWKLIERFLIWIGSLPEVPTILDTIKDPLPDVLTYRGAHMRLTRRDRMNQILGLRK